MGHLLLARCSRADPSVVALDRAFGAALEDPGEARLTRLSRLDLDRGPRLGRIRAAMGLGWQARDRIRHVETTEGPIDAVVEVCVCGHHHLLGLGRTGVATVRWSPRGPDARTWLDRLAAAEGAEVVLEGKAIDAAHAPNIVRRILLMLEAARRPETPVPGPSAGKA